VKLIVRTRVRRARAALLVAALAVGLLSACSSSGGGTPTLLWYINPDNGGQATLAKECTAASNGAYKIKTQLLPNDASQQLQQLTQRLAAKDSSIDLMSIDPVNVAEFSNAGFLAPIPTSDDAQFTNNIVSASVKSSTWNGKLVAIPFWANTQLLWYRKSLVAKAGLDMTKPVTWDQIIDAAQTLKKTVGVQSALYEGYTVWINALVAGAGGSIVENPGATAKDTKLGLNSAAGQDAAAVIAKLAKAGVGGPALSSSEESQSLALFEDPATSMFVTIWPYIWAQMGPANDNVSFRNTDIGWAPYPETVAGTASKPPFGGIDIGIGNYSNHKTQALAAGTCITTEQHQLEYMLSSGNPAANKAVYDNAEIQKDFPMADLIRTSLDDAAPRPQSQYYGDLSTALQKEFSPPNSVTASTPKKASEFILDVLKGERLL
jgi:multiple sugar transport system substrate-binding protein